MSVNDYSLEEEDLVMAMSDEDEVEEGMDVGDDEGFGDDTESEKDPFGDD